MAESECELRGELSYRNGERQRFATRSPNTISGILGGVRRLQEQVSGALSQLVLQEKQAPGAETPASGSGEDDDNEDESDEDREDEPANKGDGGAPPAKRTKKQS
uniref:uncharacterized protein n=1 Tax=Pristiophorus japonicus TaxID=55135 RepID=UPI00398E9DA8